MRKLILVILLLPCTLTAILCAGVVIADTLPPEAPKLELPKTKFNQKDGAEMVLVPAGEFLMGISEEELEAWLQAHSEDKRELFLDEMPRHKVYLNAFYIYKNEVTVAQYRSFCQATGRAMPFKPSWKLQDKQPVVNVTWNDAQAYATWAQACLPTEAQWEKAARGTDGRIFPWGNVWDSEKCSHAANSPKAPNPVGSFPAGASPYGVLDMAGNVEEWCADWYGVSYYRYSPTTNPVGPTEAQAAVMDALMVKNKKYVQERLKMRVLRGGSIRYRGPGYFRTTDRYGFPPTGLGDNDGFRCVVCLPG
jgi:formylglycine-generating enzyme